MAQSDWTTIRVSKDTLRQLEACRESMREGDDKAQFPLDSPAVMSGGEDKRDRIGLDRVIRRLLADRQRHADRRKTSAGRRAARGGASVSEANPS